MQTLEPMLSPDSEEMINLCNMDFPLVEATLASITTGTLTPLIKEELRLKIQSSRLAAGKEEMPTPVFKEPEKDQLTEEDKERRTKRRERNRIAALKCRRKKKDTLTQLTKELQALKDKNFSLRSLLASMEKEKQDFLEKLNNRPPSRQTVSPQPFTRPQSLQNLATPSPTFSDVSLCSNSPRSYAGGPVAGPSWATTDRLSSSPRTGVPDWEKIPNFLLHWTSIQEPEGCSSSFWDRGCLHTACFPALTQEGNSSTDDNLTSPVHYPTSPDLRPGSDNSAWEEEEENDVTTLTTTF